MIVISKKNFVVALAMTLAIFLSSNLLMTQTVQAATLKDLNQCADYAKPAVTLLAQNGLISGDQNGYFNPQQSITLAQMFTLNVKSLGFDKTCTPYQTNSFKDVPQGHWANKYVEIAYQSGITSGVAPNQFGVNQTCTREQMITLFVNSLKLMDAEFTTIPAGLINLGTFSDAAKISDWARDPVAFSVYMGLISGTSATTMDPKTAAQRQQVAVLTDRFIDKQDNIIKDMQAQRILGKTITAQFNGQGISNTGDIEIKINLQDAILGLPAAFSLKAHMINEMLWPATMHQSVKTELIGLPSSDYSALEMDQYLVDGVMYQNIPDENNNANWVRMSSADTPDINDFMQTIKDAQISQLLLPDDIHKTANVTLEDAEVNESDGHKITYTGQIADISVLLNQILPAALPGNIDSSQFQDILDMIKQSVKSINFSEVFYVGADNLIYATQYSITIDCKDASNALAIPVKTVVITGSTDNYKYDDITIVLPPEAQAAL